MSKTRKPRRICADPKENGTDILANWTSSLKASVELIINGTDILANWTSSLKASVELIINLSPSERNFTIRNYYYDTLISSKTELRPTRDRN